MSARRAQSNPQDAQAQELIHRAERILMAAMQAAGPLAAAITKAFGQPGSPSRQSARYSEPLANLLTEIEPEVTRFALKVRQAVAKLNK